MGNVLSESADPDLSVAPTGVHERGPVRGVCWRHGEVGQGLNVGVLRDEE